LYPHDFAVGSILVTGARRQMVPASVTVPEGAASADFVVSTSSVSAVTTAIISATYGVTHSANLAINPSVLDGITLTQPSVTGGTASIATVTLTGAAPSGGAVVMLAANDPVAPGLQKVTDAAGMPHDGSVNWSSIGSNFAPVDSGTSVPVAGLPGLQMTLSASANQPLQILTNCPGIVNCGWGGNFAPGAQLLWVGGNYDENGETWTGHGPMTLTLTSPQHGIGFRIMADELGPFTATLCAYGAADQLLGCMPFTGNGDVFPNNSAAFFGFYSDAGEIAKVTLDAGGALYPHDFAIEQVFVSSTRRMVPPSVKVEAGASTATFRVNTNTVETQTPVTITGDYQTTRTADLAILP
jgi:hypothetical protein